MRLQLSLNLDLTEYPEQLWIGEIRDVKVDGTSYVVRLSVHLRMAAALIDGAGYFEVDGNEVGRPLREISMTQTLLSMSEVEQQIVAKPQVKSRPIIMGAGAGN